MNRTLGKYLPWLVAGSALILSTCTGGGGDTSTPVVVSPCTGGAASTTPTESGTAILSWDPVATASLSGYRVYYGSAPGTYFQPVGQGLNAGNFTTYSISGLNRGARYYFSVTAYDAADAESAYSNEVCKDMP